MLVFFVSKMIVDFFLILIFCFVVVIVVKAAKKTYAFARCTLIWYWGSLITKKRFLKN